MLCGMLLTVLLVAALALCAEPIAHRAWADEGSGAQVDAAGASVDFSGMSLDQLKAEVTARETQLRELRLQAGAQIARMCGNSARRLVVERRLNAREALARRAVADRYKLQRHGAPLIDAFLHATDLNEFIACLRYIEAASNVGVKTVVELRAETQLRAQESELLATEEEALKGQIARAEADLQAATIARDEAQRKADMVAATHLVPDGADWDAGEEQFIQVWAPRLNAYLSGSPLDGQGETFAKAAWDNHIDPRWSAAISTMESSKGRACIRPHNAWGWGAADSNPYALASEWATWEEAINAHARGLARGYGYTVSVAGAQTYCPPNWENWYVVVVNEMNRI